MLILVMEVIPSCINQKFPNSLLKRNTFVRENCPLKNALIVFSHLKITSHQGNDGLTAEFYKTFWNSVGGILVDSLNCAYDLGELSNSQKQAIIKLIEKKEKDKRKICNWRPISLINVDAKIGSKAIATRLKRVLPDIIHHNQNAYVKGRSILDAVRTIDDIFEYTERRKSMEC